MGGKLKRTHYDLIAMNTSLTINNVGDLKRVVEPHLDTRINIFTKEDVEQIRSHLPTKINSLTGAFKLHHLVFSADGKVRSSLLPGQPMREVVVKPSWRVARDRTAAPLVTVYEEGEQEDGQQEERLDEPEE